jgi:hypothetical protein
MPPEMNLEERLKAHFWNPEGIQIAGISERGHRIYRRQVRNNMFGAVKRALPIAIHLAGEKKVGDLIQQWLLSSPPQTRFYWELPVEFGMWVGSGEHATQPLALGELIQWEVMEISVLNGENPSHVPGIKDPADDLHAVLHPATRLGVYAHPVHRLTRDDVAWPKPTRVPNCVVGYRVGEKMHWLMISPQAAQLLAHLGAGVSVGQALNELESLSGSLDRRLLLAKLSDLVHRGALLGFEKAGGT